MNHSQKLARIKELMAHPAMVELDKLSAEVAEIEWKKYPVPIPTLGEAMKFRRFSMNETVEQIAKRAGMSPRMWSMFESDGLVPSLTNAAKLAKVGIPAEVIINSAKP